MKKNIPDQISIQSDGIKTVKKTCEKHGEYNAKVFKFTNDREFLSHCPECTKEREMLLREEEEKAEKNKRQGLINKFMGNSGIPPRFIDKSLLTLKSLNSKQEKVYKTVDNYLNAILSGETASLIMCGKPGTGKTHIACSFVKQMILNEKESRIITTANLMRQVKDTYKKESEYTENDIYYLYENLPLLVIDEVGVQFGSDTEKLIFYEVINRRYNNLLPTVLISNLTSEELKGFIGERAFDRFKEDGGAILAFDWESYRK